MLFRSKPTWWISENQVTPEHIYHNRRNFMKLAGGAALGASLVGRMVEAQEVPKNPSFLDAGRPLTKEEYATTY
ncbi:MAG: twin-arginine translocation signal domain-containing protein, partial [Pseudomonadota bacterium]